VIGENEARKPSGKVNCLDTDWQEQSDTCCYEVSADVGNELTGLAHGRTEVARQRWPHHIRRSAGGTFHECSDRLLTRGGNCIGVVKKLHEFIASCPMVDDPSQTSVHVLAKMHPASHLFIDLCRSATREP
jgi:hypothetical protein